MKSFFTLLSFTLLVTLSFAQPSNDNCSGAINLGTVPTCLPQVYTNMGATASNIGTGNNPSCFNGGTPQRDVWFTFTTTTEVRDLNILVKGVATGTNAKAMANPQIALYRGTCTNNGLSQIACISAPNGAKEVKLEVENLTANVTYFLRINDYSPSATPNAGDFTVCIQPFVPKFNMGDATGSTGCFGTLYDSGGPTGDYQSFEDNSFTICPNEPHACIDIELVNYEIEPALLGIFGDRLSFYAGENLQAPLISSYYGQDLGRPFHIQTSNRCITVRFESDFFTNYGGFELNWQCSASPCENRSYENPTEIPTLPFNVTGLSTCESALTNATSPCGGDDFLSGPSYVFTYNSLGGSCISVTLAGAEEGTGVLILDGVPELATTNCIARSSTGVINSANLLQAGTYYIVVANGNGCTPFDISVQETNCSISPALVSALCNPLNGCVRLDGLPTVFDFEDGFQDMQIERNVNNGCWLGYGVEPNFYWFTIQSQADGKFGFILDSANPDVPSDLDFNVWGPFRQTQVCDSAQQVIQFIRSNQPTRSSWSPTSGPTGLTDRHPETGAPITDVYDCGNQAGADGDDFVSTIPTKKGDVYVVLINDWEDLIGDEGVGINWLPSDRPVLEQLPAKVVAGDTAICKGASVQIKIESPINAIRWLNDTTTLSCKTCPNPIATPTKTTTYRALVDAVCYNDTVSVKVEVYDANAGPDVTTCRGEQFQIVAGGNFSTATYQWTAPAGIQLSCNNCPNPTLTAVNSGTFNVVVQLAAPSCLIRDTVRITVLNQQAPTFSIRKDTTICAGDSISLGNISSPGVTYNWTSNPIGFSASNANPRVAPTQTTTYILSAQNGQCPVASLDSVTVTVYERPTLVGATDTANLCQEQPIRLGNTLPQGGVVYNWSGPDIIDNKKDPNTLAFPSQSGAYVLDASSGNGLCRSSDTVNVTIVPIDVNIKSEDTVKLCRGESLALEVSATPANTPVIWSPNDGSLSDTIGYNITARPQKTTVYIAKVTVNQCVRMDTVVVLVDSLPANLSIQPGDTTICQGSQVILESEIFEPKDFPGIKFLWEPAAGQLTPDSLYNMVIQPDTTTRYYRISTNGVCRDTAFADVTVNPIPIVEIMPSDTTVCPGARIDFKVKTTPTDVEKPKWEPATGLSCVECLEPSLVATATAGYTLKVEYKGCPGSGSTKINVLLAPILQLNPKTTICLGDSIQLNLASTPGATYTWTSTDDPNFRSNNPRVIVRPTRTSTYKVIASNGGCAAPEASITINVIQPATVNIIGDSIICRGDTLTLTAVGTAPSTVAQNYQWEFNGQFKTGATLTVPGLTQDTRIRLIYTYGDNCGVVIKNVNVDVQESILIQSITVKPDTVYEGQTVTLTANTIPANPTGATYAWTANGTSIPGNSPQIQHTPTVNPTTYAVRITSANGCVSSSAVQVAQLTVKAEVPNAFTPNGDNKNDFFDVVTPDGAPRTIIEFRVFNRWGQLVYNNDNPDRGWDGKQNGKDAPSDVYVYYIVVDVQSGRKTFKGDVTLIR